jgi:hypothetical protein
MRFVISTDRTASGRIYNARWLFLAAIALNATSENVDIEDVLFGPFVGRRTEARMPGLHAALDRPDGNDRHRIQRTVITPRRQWLRGVGRW